MMSICNMRQIFMFACFQIIILLLCLCAVSASAQESGRCFRNLNPQFKGYSKQLQGYILKIEQKKDIKYEDYQCRASVISPGGKVIFQADDSGMELNKITGKDLNGDGRPDAVFEGYSGGAHCCWTYWIVSLGDRPGLIQKIENETAASFQDINKDGRIEIRTLDGAFDYFDSMAHAYTPFPTVIFRLEGRTLKDVGYECKDVYDRDIAKMRSELDPSALDRFRTGKNINDGELDETISTVLTIVLDYLYSGREQAAWQALREMWPSYDVPRIRKKIIETRANGILKKVQR